MKQKSNSEFVISKTKTGKMAFRCLRCGKTSVYPAKTSAGRTCAHCGGYITPIGYAKIIKPDANKDSVSSAPTESAEQQQLFQWASWLQPRHPELALMYHIPNEGKRSRATGGRMCAEGLKAGVPDICLPVPSGKYHGLYIEMKRIGGRVSCEQRRWIQLLAEQGYQAVVCFGFEEAARTIMEYLGLKGDVHHVR